ncbi:MerR family transcriptional regulator [Catenuloplanes sp. NPDC051500]|uniref:MerR family transcriptional regulator n=1 Tax=Catenuloplanes sp. NPDC051500 TaxID=3363959 RepID=UPI003787AB8D
MRIGELAARTGVSTRSLRYYEQQGLLVSTRSATGQRHYEEDHIDRVRTIQAYLTAGVPSRTIAEMVPCMDSPSLREARHAAEVMDRERQRLSESIDDLTTARTVLDALIESNKRFLRAQERSRAR